MSMHFFFSIVYLLLSGKHALSCLKPITFNLICRITCNALVSVFRCVCVCVEMHLFSCTRLHKMSADYTVIASTPTPVRVLKR